MKVFIYKLLPFLKRTYYVVLAFFFIAFFGMSVIKTNLIWSVVSLVCLMLGLLMVKKVRINYSWITRKWVPYLIYLISFFVRLVYCMLVMPFINQISDFRIVLEEAGTGYFLDCLEYYRFYFHKFLYPFVLHGLSLNTQARIIIFQCVVVAFVPVLLFEIGRKVVDERVGILAAAIYALWPSVIVYTQIVTEEHISALATTLIIYLLICSYQQIVTIGSWDRSGLYVLAKAGAVGLLCGVAAYSKDWALVILTAAIICAVYQILQSNWIQVCVLVAAFVLIVCGRSVFNIAIKNVGEGTLGVSPNNGVINMQMYETLDPNSNGGYNVELNDEYMKIAEENGYDFERTNAITNKILKEKIKNDYNKMPKLLLHKAQNAYKSNDSMLGLALEKEVIDGYKEKLSIVFRILRKVDQLIYLCVFILAIISSLVNKNKYVFFLQLIMLGGAFVSLIVESQQRYKYSIISTWCIPAAYALVWLIDKSKSKERDK